MAIDTTQVIYTCNPLVEQLANLGINMNIGGDVLERAPRDNINITYNGTKGWRPVGVSETIINFVLSATYYKAQTGMVKTTKDVKQTDINLEVPVVLMTPTWFGERLAHGWGTQVITQPTTPIATTIDATVTVINPNYQIGVTAITSFAVDQEIGIITGDATFGTEEEYSEIASIDVIGKIITLKYPIFQTPADLAAVRVITGKRIITTSCSDAPAQQFRIVKYDRSRGKTVVEHARDMRLSGFSGVTNIQGAATTYGFSLTGIANFDILTNTYSLSSHNKLST